MNINAGLGRISSWQPDRNIRYKCLHVGVLKWISNPACLILISKTRSTRAYVFRFKEQKKNHLELNQEVKLLNTV